MCTCRIRVVACIAALQGVALAQDAAPQAAQPEVAPLAGPKVPERKTLVSTDMQGRFRRLENRPEVAALEILEIDPERLDRARNAVERRNSAVHKHLVDNLALIKQWTDPSRSGDPAAVEKMGRELYDRFDPGHARDPLLESLSKELSADEAAELGRLVDEYWERAVDFEQAKNRKQSRADAQARLSYELFQRDVRRAYDIGLRPYQQKLEKICAAVDPTPAQREAMRNAMIEYIRASFSAPDPAQRLRLARGIYEALDEERRVKLLAVELGSM